MKAASTTRIERFPGIEAHYGSLTPLDYGMQSRIYLTADGQSVVKVYRNQRGDHLREAHNLKRAGMGEWVQDTLALDGVEALVMRRFLGHPLGAADIPRALPRLREVLDNLHAARQGQVDLSKLRERLARFRSALAAYPLEDLFEAVEDPLERGLLEQPAAFCHLDLWHDNILVAEQSDDVLVIDWNKAGWDDPLRDIALLKTGSLDLLPAEQSLRATLSFLPDHHPATLTRLRAYLALTTLHDLYWFLMNEPYEFEEQRDHKIPRTRYALVRLPA